jgi:hypothetical protein
MLVRFLGIASGSGRFDVWLPTHMCALDRSQVVSAVGNTRRAAAATKPFGAQQVCANGHRCSRVLVAHLAVYPFDCMRESACTCRRWIGAETHAAR